MKPLFDAIIEHVPPPAGEFDKPVQILITNIDYDEYIGRIGIGRVERGSVRSGQWLVSCTADKIIEPVKMSKPVSYTHLDVYKRQFLSNQKARAKLNTFCPKHECRCHAAPVRNAACCNNRDADTCLLYTSRCV